MTLPILIALVTGLCGGLIVGFLFGHYSRTTAHLTESWKSLTPELRNECLVMVKTRRDSWLESIAAHRVDMKPEVLSSMLKDERFHNVVCDLVEASIGNTEPKK